jgi:hypothetical protein
MRKIVEKVAKKAAKKAVKKALEKATRKSKPSKTKVDRSNDLSSSSFST